VWWVAGPSPNFKWSEFQVNSAGLPNTMPFPVRITATRLAFALLEPLRRAFGPIRINSGFRSSAVNASIPGASSTSSHMALEPGELGLDVQAYDGSVTNRDLAEWLYNRREQHGYLDQVIVYDDRSHLHVGVRAQPRGVWLAHNEGTYRSWAPG